MAEEEKQQGAQKQGRGILFVLSAPSGVGKTVIADYIVSRVPDVKQSVSCTTRPMRKNEVDGESYMFVSEERFEEMKEKNCFIEWAEVHGNFYGTAFDTLKNAKEKNLDLLLVIDVQGAGKLRKKNLPAVFIFLLPPSMKELERRIRLRGSEDSAQIDLRLATAEQEIKFCADYDYIVVNDTLETAQGEVENIIMAERNKTGRHFLRFPDYELPPKILE